MGKIDKKEIAHFLEEIAIRLQILGENPYRVRAFQNAGRAVERLQEDIERLIREGKLESVKGIGKTTAKLIQEMIETGEPPALLKDLQEKLPESVMDLLEIRGLGPGRISLLYRKLGIRSVDELEQALESGQLLALEGFGPKTLTKIRDGIERFRAYRGKFLLGKAYPLAQELYAELHAQGFKAEIVGSVRRFCPVVQNINVVLTGKTHEQALEIVKKTLQGWKTEDLHGAEWRFVHHTLGIPCLIEWVPEDLFPWTIRYRTGSKTHNEKFYAFVVEKGFTWDGLCIHKDNKRLPVQTEEDIFHLLDLQYIPPELREGGDEIVLAEKGKLPELVNVEDIQGLIHVHSHWSDGADSIEELVIEARSLGLSYIVLTDHSAYAQYAHGLDEKRLEEQWKEIDRLNRKYSDFHIFKGMEVDILPDGSLDLAESHLQKLDVVIAAIHSRFQMKREDMMNRILKAIRNPYTTIFAHPTGRLLLGRKGYEVDFDILFRVCAETGTLLEINANPHRLDLDWTRIPQARKHGIRFSIDPDTHHKADLRDYIYGVGIARKGGLTPEIIANTQPVDAVIQWLRKNKKDASLS